MGHALETLQLGWAVCEFLASMLNGALTNGNICFVDF